MDRTQIYLDARETAALDRIAAETGRTRSELIREAIAAVYIGPQDISARTLVAALELSAGCWSLKSTGKAYVESLRKGRRLARAVDR